MRNGTGLKNERVDNTIKLYFSDDSDAFKASLSEYFSDKTAWGSKVSANAIGRMFIIGKVPKTIPVLKSLKAHHKMLEGLAVKHKEIFHLHFLEALNDAGVLEEVASFGGEIDYGKALCKALDAKNEYPLFMSTIVPCSTDYVGKAFRQCKWTMGTVAAGWSGPNKGALLLGLAATNELDFHKFVKSKVLGSKALAAVGALCDGRNEDFYKRARLRLTAAGEKPQPWEAAIGGGRISPETGLALLNGLRDDLLTLPKGKVMLNELLGVVLQGGDKEKTGALLFALKRPSILDLAKSLMDLGCKVEGDAFSTRHGTTTKLSISEFMVDQLWTPKAGAFNAALEAESVAILSTFEHAAIRGYIPESQPPLWQRFLDGADKNSIKHLERKFNAVNWVSPFPSFEACIKVKPDLPQSLMSVLARLCPKEPLKSFVTAPSLESDVELG